MALSQTTTSSMMYLSFLRPLALPRASTLTRFLSTTTNLSTSASLSSSSSSSPPSSPAQSATISQSSTPAIAPLLPYRVARTPSKNLPIYLLAKRGGNLKQTRLRKIEGNIAVLRDHLQDALQMERKDVVINGLTKQIIIKGWHKPQVAKFLEERQF